MSIARLMVLLVLMALTAWCGRDNISSRLGRSHQASPVQPVSQLQHYTVVKGDSLLMISVRLGIPYQTLAVWNGLQPPFLLKEGQILTLRAPDNFARVQPKSVAKSSRKVVRSALKADWQWPVTGRVVRQFDGEDSNGLDLAVNPGQPIKAVAAGRVVYAGDSVLGYGNLLILKHDEQFLTAYGNNRRLLVRQGDEVHQGQIIAEAADHLANSVVHFEIRKNGDPVNPMEYLPPPSH